MTGRGGHGGTPDDILIGGRWLWADPNSYWPEIRPDVLADLRDGRHRVGGIVRATSGEIGVRWEDGTDAELTAEERARLDEMFGGVGDAA